MNLAHRDVKLGTGMRSMAEYALSFEQDMPAAARPPSTLIETRMLLRASTRQRLGGNSVETSGYVEGRLQEGLFDVFLFDPRIAL